MSMTTTEILAGLDAREEGTWHDLLALPSYREAMFRAAERDYHAPGNQLRFVILVRQAYLDGHWPATDVI